MKIQKRNGGYENLSLNKITYRLRKICNDKKLGKLKNIDPDLIAQKVVNMIYDGISSSEIDELTAQITIALATENPEYGSISSRVIISNMHKNTTECFSEVMESLYNYKDNEGTLVCKSFIKVVRENKEILDLEIDYDRDFNLEYFGYKTLEKGYLNRIYKSKKEFIIVERPQHMFMRVAIGIHKNNIDKVIETYRLMSKGFFTHATPTLFNAGSSNPQLSSCFLLSGGVDSIVGIYKNITDCALISKWSGGIGFHIHDIRTRGANIRGTNGVSDGVVPMLRVYNTTAKYVNQGGGKRAGSFAVYMEPWHADIMEFLDMKRNHGSEDDRARDLFYALWVPDLFMKKVETDSDWYLMCPNQSPGLSDVYSDRFDELYNKYVEEGLYIEKVKARDIWQKIVSSQTETGGPYMLYKDACNEKSNQKNIGTIKSSNLCAEITLVSSKKEIAVCNLASIALPKFVKTDGFFSLDNYDFEDLHRVVKIVIKNLDKVIDENFYPVPEAKVSNMRHRPLGLGIQGLADTYMKLRVAFDSEEASLLNRHIFEVIQHAALESSMELSKENGPYSTFAGSPMSEGKFQHNLWGVEDSELLRGFDWDKLRNEIKEHGIRNSTLTALMPTASTSQILGNSECFEQYQSNIFIRRTLSGEFPVVNKYLVNDLSKINMWNKNIRDEIIKDSGSIQNIDSIPQEIKNIYKTVWETSQKKVIDQSADRGIFIDQSQSMNLYLSEPTYKKITSMHFYGWKKGLKTGQYYLRTKAAREAIKVTIDTPIVVNETPDGIECSDDICVMCSG
jgi:ribonucleoside-diphosphate reductase alpha chain